MKIIIFILEIVFAYLIGAIPSAYLIFRMVKKEDIRKYGSGNVGATNVMRNAGKLPGIITFIMDFTKGVVPVLVFPYLFHSLLSFAPIFNDIFYLKLIIGTCTVLGHIFPVYINFKGGKGVAVLTGAFVILFPLPVLSALVLFVLLIVILRTVSISVLIASLFQGLFALFYFKFSPHSYFALLPFLIFLVSHSSNIKRLLKGKEKKIF